MSTQPILKRKLDATAASVASDQKQSTAAAVKFVYIASLNANTDSTVTIRARIIEKYGIRTWDNERTGKGCLFSVDVACEHPDQNPSVPGSVIRITAFNDVCLQLEPVLQIGDLCSFRNFKVKKKNAKFNALPNPFEINLDKDSVIEQLSNKRSCTGGGSDGGSGFQLPSLKFSKLSEIKSMELDSTVNTVVLVMARAETIEYVHKTSGKLAYRRTIHFIDDSKHEISMCVHGQDKCENVLFEEGTPLVFKRVVFSAWNDDRALKTTQSTTFVRASADMPEAVPLLNWIQSTTDGERTSGLTKISKDTTKRQVEKRVTCAQLTSMLIAGGFAKYPELNLDQAELDACGGNIVFKLAAVIHKIKSDPERGCTMLSCGTCSKKVQREKNGFKCNKCQIFITQPSRSYLLNCTLYDDTGMCDVTIFHEVARQLLKEDAMDMWKRCIPTAAAAATGTSAADPEEQDPNMQTGGHKLLTAIEDRIQYKEFVFTLRENHDNSGKIYLNVSRANAFDTPQDYEREEKALYIELNSDL